MSSSLLSTAFAPETGERVGLRELYPSTFGTKSVKCPYLKMSLTLLLDAFITKRLSSALFILQTTPVEFFGVPLNDQELLDADPWYVLGACKRFISPGTYEEHFTHLTCGYRTPKQVLRSLLEVLAGLDSKDQDECLEAIIHALREASEEGFSHVIERLQKGTVGENTGNEVAVPSDVRAELHARAKPHS